MPEPAVPPAPVPARTRWRRPALRAAYVALAATDTALAASTDPRAHRLRRYTKPALLPLLVAGNPAGDQRLLVTAQLASTAGDVALLRSGDGALRAGMTAFAVAQGSYLTRFVLTRRTRTAPAATATRTIATPGLPRLRAAFGVLAGTNAVVAGVAARRRDPALQAPTTAYGLLLSAMALGAFSARGTRAARILVSAGAASFVFSDSVLAVREHVWPEAPAVLEGAVMASYTSAQLLLAEGISALPR